MKQVDKSHKSEPCAVSRRINGCQYKIDGDIGNNRKPTFSLSHAGILFIIVMLWLSIFAGGAGAAHTVDTNATDGTAAFATSPNPRTLSYTAGTGSTVMVLNIFTATLTARAGGAPTFNGKTFNQVGTRQSDTSEGAVEMWYLLLTSADTGSAYTVSVPNTGSLAMRIHVSTYKSALGKSALDVYAQTSSTGSTNPTQSITTTANGDAIVAGMFTGLNTAPTVTSPGVNIYINGASGSGTYKAASQYILQSSFGTQATAWTSGTSDDWAMITAAFKEVASAGTTYTISGYITNKTSASPLNGATVMTNTSESATSNATGFYKIYGLSNGTYIITATLNGYDANQTTKTISGSNTTNANISLTKAQTYRLWGFVANDSNGDIISGATVITNTGLTTTTNGTGYYNFTVSNGTYFITVMMTDYLDKFELETIDGADVILDIYLIPLSGGKLLVATNRYVILDDPISGTAPPAPFVNPGFTTASGWNYWTGTSSTMINATALFIDGRGSPVINQNITFNLYQPNGTEYVPARTNSTTNDYGLASFSFDMNARNYYGNWTVKATKGNINVSTSFIYNWWGCEYNGGTCSKDHAGSSKTPPTGGTANSPYSNRHETTVDSYSDHSGTTLNCTWCHQSYDAKPGGSSGIHLNVPADVHRNILCSNVDCHNSLTTHRTNAVIGSCYSTTCHRPLGTLGNRSDISNKSTLDSALLSLYSYDNGSTFNSTFHTIDSTVPCIICHGPMHNITKPDATQRFIKNNNTEQSHCLTCHASYKNHNSSNLATGGVNCTFCHSDDAHNNMLFSWDAKYVPYTNTSSIGNCTTCHQNSSFYSALKLNSWAGSQTGNAPRSIINLSWTQIKHSDDLSSGTKYNYYWDWTETKAASCNYCHGFTNHEDKALGRPGSFNNGNTVNSSIGNTTWCISCHDPVYQNYSDMLSTFIDDLLNIPPSVIKGTDYYISGKDHSLLGTNDSSCYSCHNGTNVYSTITQFMHGVYVGGGGPDCMSCHDMGKNGSILHVNNSVMNISIHKNLNNITPASGVSAENKKCWGCHQSDGSKPGPTSMGDMYSHPYTCYDCHKNGVKPYANVSNASSVTNHIDVESSITRILTHNARCATCHNNSVNLGNASIIDERVISQEESVSHYGTISKLIKSVSDPQGCVYCHLNITNRAIWGQAHDPGLNSVEPHIGYVNNSQCYICHIQAGSVLPKSFHNESFYYKGVGRIIVATNRMVILDDPRTSGKSAQTADNFAIPPRTDWTSDYWNGARTQINGYALLLNSDGHPITNTQVNFTVSNWNNAFSATLGPYNTNSDGIASFNYDMNNKNYYGRWTVKASAMGQNGSTGFIYNWWGCQATTGCSESHGSKTASSYETPGDRNSPYTRGAESITGISNHGSTQSDANCVGCHRSYSGKGGGNTFTGQATNTSDVHVTKTCVTCHGTGTQHTTDQPIRSCNDIGCHNRTDISMKSTKNGIISNYSNSTSSAYNQYHTPNATIPCILCHGPMHNISKLDTAQKPIKNNETEYTQCVACHQVQARHNNSVGCSVCHSDDIHVIKVFSQSATYVTLNHDNPNASKGNCGNCHQNSSFWSKLTNTTLNPKVGNFSGIRSPAQVQVPMNHSEDSLAGAKWNQTTTPYWNRSDQVSSCKFCHNVEVHAANTLGKISFFKGSNTLNSTIGNTYWCASCHWQGYSSGSNTYNDMVNTFLGLVPPEITGHLLYGANQSNLEFFNHSTLNKSDSSCKSCHGNLTANVTTMTRFVHNVAVGTMGGPDCISCHNYGAGGAEHRINSTAMNSSGAIHRNLNSNATNSTGVPAANKKCWGCHQSNGSQPSGMGDRFGTPYKCFDCHRTTNKPYANVSNAASVSEHFKNGNDIKSATSASDSSTSCLVCHNLSEMKVSYVEDDAYNSNYSLSSHYGRNRSDLRLGSSTNCTYCHRNTSTAFTVAMVDASYTKNISNHSQRYNSTNPGCTSSQCHNTGWIHNSTLTKPVLTLPDSTLCLSCHGDNGSGVTIYTGAVTGVKAKHNNSIDCTECHLSVDRDIHRVKYLQSNASFNNSNSTAVNCIICHQQTTAVDSNLSKTPPKIPSPMHHSNNISNGSIWNTSFWTGSSPLTGCIYCHNDSKHDSSALGRPANWKGNNIVNSSISVTSNWCSGCHWQGYVSGSKNYNDMVNKFLNSGILVPPEITGNATYKPGGSGYINHTDFGKFDSACKGCHGMNATGSNIKSLMHNVATGITGGPDCISCHDKTGSGSNLKVNNSAMNSSSSVHKDLNNNATATGVSAENKKCWGCHQTNGTQPGGNSMGDRVSAPYTCIDCHSATKPYVNVSTAPNVSQHIPSADRVFTAASCSNCHNNSANFTLANIIDSRVITLEEKVSHYGTNTSLFDTVGNTNASQGCIYCHYDPVNSAIWGNAPDPRNSAIRPHSETSNNDCYACHIVGGINVANSMDNFHNDPLYSVNRYTYNPIPARNATASMIFSRKVILDDPVAGQNGTGFAAPNPYPWNGADYWNGESTTLRAYSLIMNTSGLAANGADVTFVLKMPNGTIINQTTIITGSDGIAPYVYDMNAKNFYGNWTLNVSAIVEGSYANSSVQFIYNWWGCAQCHTERNVTSYGIVTSKSPYLEGYDKVHIGRIDHNNRVNASDCIYCHRSYGNGTAGSQYTTDMHENKKTCQGCHTGANGTNGTPAIPSCTQCHNSTTNSNLSYKSTLSGNLSVYSGNATTPLKDHNSEVPCVICHDAMHKITTPYPAGANNNVTEMQNCITCHINSNHTKNKPGLDCTKCHSQDAHAIKFITNLTTAPTANYSVNRSSAARCEECHNNSGLNSYFVASGFSPKKNDSYGYNFTKHNNIVSCNTCHDRIHWIGYLNTSGSYNISKTSVVGCIDCHNITNNEVKNATEAWGNVIPVAYKHNNSISCETCHASSKHGIRYLQQDKASFGTKTNAVNCTSCHWQGYLNATQVPNPLKHSNNMLNGSVWGSYWTNTSQVTACIYCHSDSKHSLKGLGFINMLTTNPSNIKNGSLSTTTWCADCHYNQSNANYKGNQWNPVPPLITFNNTGKNNWVNHSGFLNGGYTDNDCRSCHSINGSGTTSLNYSHSLDEGIAGGPNCVACHIQGGIAGVNRTVNLTAMNDTNAVHMDLNNNVTTSYSAENKKCWACHGTGIEPSGGHPTNYKTPYQCADCHTNGGTRSAVYLNATRTYKHYDGSQVYGPKYFSIVNCSDCHKNSLVPNFNISQYSININGTLANVSHYATKNGLVITNESFGCNNCHSVGGSGGINGPYYGNAGGLPGTHNSMGATGVSCQLCHNANVDTNVSLHDNSMGISWNGCFGSGCH